MQRNFFWSGTENRKGLPPISWEIIQRSKRFGDLGVDDLIIKNDALLFKWWCRFSKDGDSLWKRTMYSIHNLQPDKLLVNQENRRRLGGVWDSITSIYKWGRNFEQVIQKGIQMRVGDGKNLSFWEDKWVGGMCLKIRFPRLFLFSVQKEEKIANMGVWDGIQWQWNLTWRGNLFQWEIEQVEELLNDLKEVSLARDMHDRPWWSYEHDGNFTIKSFSKAIWDANGAIEDVNNIWLGVAPPTAELLVWFVVQQKINTRERLKILNLVQTSDALCPFCESGEETVVHLFLHCPFTWRIWSDYVFWWGLQMPIAKTPTNWFECWNKAFRGNFQKKPLDFLFLCSNLVNMVPKEPNSI